MIKLVIFSILLFPFLLFSQYSTSVINIEKEISLCTECIIDTVKFKNEITNITYYITAKDSLIQKGYKSIDAKGQLIELEWNSTNFVRYFFMFNSSGIIYMSNLTIKEVGKTITYFYENGKIARIENYNFGNCLDGWVISFDESGLLTEKVYYSNGKKSKKKSNKQPCEIN